MARLQVAVRRGSWGSSPSALVPRRGRDGRGGPSPGRATSSGVLRTPSLPVLALLCALRGGGPGASAQARPAAHPALLEATLTADPLDVARVAARIGDDAVLAALASDAPARRFAAIRAVTFLGAPEAALPALVGLAAGRDPDLAPAAAAALLDVARALRPDDLARRESDAAALVPARDAARRLAADATARSDVRRAAALAAGALAALAP
jgi:hypothetical protein